MKSEFIKKQVLLSVILGAEFELFELTGPQGQTIKITDDAAELLSFLRETPGDDEPAAKHIN